MKDNLSEPMKVEASLESALESLPPLARSILNRDDAFPIHDIHVLSAGKLLRPRVLFLFSLHVAEVGGTTVDWKLARNAALAIEFAHVGTLYHDDIVDRSDTRRGAPAVHRQWGVHSASVAGVHLLLEANSLVSRFPDPLPKWWGRAALDVSAGQLAEMESAGDLSTSIESHLETARRKTGALFELAARFGAYAGGRESSDDLARLGSDLGTAFQLCDDLRDFGSSRRRKATDLQNRIYSLPILLACSSDASEAGPLRSLLVDNGRPLTPQESIQAIDLTAAAGGFEAAAEVGKSVRERFRNTYDMLPPSEALERVAELLDSFIQEAVTSPRSWV